MTFNDCLDYLHSLTDKHITTHNRPIHYVIGGEQVYNLFKPYITHIHVTHITHNSSDISFDKFFFQIPTSFHIHDYSPLYHYNNLSYRFINYRLDNNNTHCSFDSSYLNLCKHVLDSGETRTDRTGTGTISIFGQQMKFDISNYIPVLTTKRIPWKSCIQELLWFLKGHTNSKELDSKGVKIWNDNSSTDFLQKNGLSHLNEGDCGANYSFQWKHFGATYIDCHTDYSNKGFDQISYIEHLLKNEPTSRRIFLSAWNPPDLQNTVLPPCHVSCQFYVDSNRKLSCHLYQRSCDMFLGVPWNILSYSILTYILAFRNNLTPGTLIVSTGDTHLYSDHIDKINTQLQRSPITYPKLHLSDSIRTKNIDDIHIDDFELIGYFPHPTIKAHMSV